MTTDDTMRLIYLGLILASLGGWAFVEFRRNFGASLRMALAWVMIFVALMAGYGLWKDVKSGLSPQQAETETEVSLPLMSDGHYHATAMLNGVAIDFLIDTGASNIVLSPQDARAIGLDLETLAFTGQAETANGTVSTAQARVQSFDLGPFFDENLRVSVNGAEMDGSLLGMDYLGLFEIKITQNKMILQR